MLKEDYGPEHPTVRAMIATRDKLQDQLNERLAGIRRGFEIEYQVTKARLDEVQRQVDEAKNASLLLESEKYLPFRNAQREEELEMKTLRNSKSSAFSRPRSKWTCHAALSR
jgi:uncharacterized protein involved in exopolysaccharide biosynthesis